jgi:5'-nucleotidase
MRGTWPKIVALCAVAALAGACGSDSNDAVPSDTTAAPTTTTVPEAFRILVTNDDGVGAEGIDALVEALRKQPNTEVTVIAPLKNQSGTGGKTTAGDLEVTDAETASGYPAKAVDGFPADTMVHALDQGGVAERPHLVISGINEGQNAGVLVDLSGTIGAARAAATRGIPALATSQGLGDNPDYESGVEAVLAWLAEHRDDLAARDVSSSAPATLTNLNIPTCPTGEPKPAVVVPLAGDELNPLDPVDCATAYESPTSDVDAFQHGYVAQTDNLALQPANG